MPVAVQEKRYVEFLSPAAVRIQLQREGFMVFSWSDGPGAEYADHWHPHDEYIVVAEGRIIFIIDGKRFALEKGDAHLHALKTARDSALCIIT
jgi:quercetin dioxygenase-like cupin family protein